MQRPTFEFRYSECIPPVVNDYLKKHHPNCKGYLITVNDEYRISNKCTVVVIETDTADMGVLGVNEIDLRGNIAFCKAINNHANCIERGSTLHFTF
jgi:hypothetical protein